MKTASGDSLSSLIIGLFGLSVVISGLWRFFSAAGGHTGLWFGLVMGSLALVSAGLFDRRHKFTAQISAWLSLLFVGGWFCYESFIKKGISNAEPRQLIIIGATLISGLALLTARSQSSEAKPNRL